MRSSGIGRPQGRGQAGEIMCRAGLELTAQAQASTSIGIYVVCDVCGSISDEKRLKCIARRGAIKPVWCSPVPGV